MPFINGRYHMNPTMGEALEAAREAQAALLAEQQAARDAHGDGSDDAEQGTGAAPIHRIEIDSAAVLPRAAGRAARAFTARVHRGGAPETHVFASHGDLLAFLRDVLA